MGLENFLGPVMQEGLGKLKEVDRESLRWGVKESETVIVHKDCCSLSHHGSVFCTSSADPEVGDHPG